MSLANALALACLLIAAYGASVYVLRALPDWAERFSEWRKRRAAERWRKEISNRNKRGPWAA